MKRLCDDAFTALKGNYFRLLGAAALVMALELLPGFLVGRLAPAGVPRAIVVMGRALAGPPFARAFLAGGPLPAGEWRSEWRVASPEAVTPEDLLAQQGDYAFLVRVKAFPRFFGKVWREALQDYRGYLSETSVGKGSGSLREQGSRFELLIQLTRPSPDGPYTVTTQLEIDGPPA